MRFRSLVALMLLAIVPPVAHSVNFKSTNLQTGLLELYTSEGCSSCPPADRFVSQLKDEDGLWTEFIPLAFHVDYWDYIGWKDRFASADFSKRQRQYAREQSLKTVYTPGFLYNGQEWRGWLSRKLSAVPQAGEPGVLELTVADERATVKFSPAHLGFENLRVNVAILGFDLKTEVKAGENRGRKLPHDFIVLGIASNNMTVSENAYQSGIKLPKTSVSAPRYAVVSWVSSDEKISPLQATGGWLPRSFSDLGRSVDEK
ncbi:MAG: hypothetical protein ACI915_000223 [Gammaproteobacteria bacterium]|jgi:hypothetical protein